MTKSLTDMQGGAISYSYPARALHHAIYRRLCRFCVKTA